MVLTIKPNTINLTIVKRRWYHYVFEKFTKTHNVIDLCKVQLEATICCSEGGKTFIKPKTKIEGLIFSEMKYNKKDKKELCMKSQKQHSPTSRTQTQR